MQEPGVVQQADVCRRYGAEIHTPEPGSRLGLAQGAACGILPINGLGHPPHGDTSGWYMWSGAYSDDPVFFEPLHADHVVSRRAYFSVLSPDSAGINLCGGGEGAMAVTKPAFDALEKVTASDLATLVSEAQKKAVLVEGAVP